MVTYWFQNLRLNLKLFRDYIFGNLFYCLYVLGILPNFLKVQIDDRFLKCPECLKLEELKCCGCDSPQAFFKISGCKNKKWDKLKWI